MLTAAPAWNSVFAGTTNLIGVWSPLTRTWLVRWAMDKSLSLWDEARAQLWDLKLVADGIPIVSRMTEAKPLVLAS